METLERNCGISFLSQQPVFAGLWATKTNKMVKQKLKMANRKLGHFCNVNAFEVTIFRGHRFPGVTFASTFITGVWYCSIVDQILHTGATCHQRANSTCFLSPLLSWSSSYFLLQIWWDSLTASVFSTNSCLGILCWHNDSSSTSYTML